MDAILASAPAGFHFFVMFAAALAHFVSFVIIAGAVPGGAGSGCLLAIEFFVDVAASGVIGGAQTFESRLSFPR